MWMPTPALHALNIRYTVRWRLVDECTVPLEVMVLDVTDTSAESWTHQHMGVCAGGAEGGSTKCAVTTITTQRISTWGSGSGKVGGGVGIGYIRQGRVEFHYLGNNVQGSPCQHFAIQCVPVLDNRWDAWSSIRCPRATRSAAHWPGASIPSAAIGPCLLTWISYSCTATSTLAV
jgi:hypothetical protein